MSETMVRSARNYEEHLANMLEIQALKSKGTSDKEICNLLKIGHSTLQKYKSTLHELNIQNLSPEHITEKKLELDDQIQAIIFKLYNIISSVEKTHDKNVQAQTELLASLDENNPKDREKIYRLKRSPGYPVGEVSTITRLMLDAIKLRSSIWLGEDSGDNGSNRDRKVVINFKQPINASLGIEHKTEELNAIADKIINGDVDDAV